MNAHYAKNSLSPFVSVIIPTYNRCGSILQCVNSVLVQSFKNFEVIVVDDGSTDDTVSIIKEIEDSHIRYIKLPRNVGAQTARNVGIKESKGEWIAFLDSDDIYLPDSLKTRVELGVNSDFGVIHSECYVHNHKTGQRYLYKTRPLQGDIYTSALKSPSPGPTFPALLVRKDCFEQINYLDELVKSYQEWDTVIRLSKKFKFGYSPIPTFIYNLHQQKSISKNRLHSATSYEYIITKHEREIRIVAGRKTMCKHYLRTAQLFSKTSEKKKTIKYLFKAVVVWLE